MRVPVALLAIALCSSSLQAQQRRSLYWEAEYLPLEGGGDTAALFFNAEAPVSGDLILRLGLGFGWHAEGNCRSVSNPFFGSGRSCDIDSWGEFGRVMLAWLQPAGADEDVELKFEVGGGLSFASVEPGPHPPARSRQVSAITSLGYRAELERAFLRLALTASYGFRDAAPGYTGFKAIPGVSFGIAF